MRIEKIICRVLHEAHERQVEEAMEVLSEGPEGRSYSQDLTDNRPDDVASGLGGAFADATATGTSMR